LPLLVADLIKWARDSASIGATFQKAKEGPNPLSQMERKGIPRRANRDGRVRRGLRAKSRPGVPQRQPAARRGLPEETKQNATAAVRGTAALGAPRRLRWPLKKTVGIFARKLERKAIHQPHYQT